MTSRRRRLRAILLIIGLASVTSSLGGEPAPTSAPKVGYVLITIKSNMRGTLPLKPDSFWGSPHFVPLSPAHDYLLGIPPGGYAFGGLVVTSGPGPKLGMGIFDKAHFTVQIGKVIYLGENRFTRDSAAKFSWDVSDSLPEALAGLNAQENALIAGLPVEKAIPAPTGATK
jgi:hypothetical protein